MESGEPRQENIVGPDLSEHTNGLEMNLQGVAQPGSRQRGAMAIPAMPKLPHLVPGRPLSAEQSRELLVLQVQIQAQLRQQQTLVDSLKQLSAKGHGDGASGGHRKDGDHASGDIAETAERVLESLVEQNEVIARMCAGRHVVGPDPVGDSPVDDEEAGACHKDPWKDKPVAPIKSFASRDLGTKRAVCMKLNEDSASEPHADTRNLWLNLPCSGHESDSARNPPNVEGDDTGEPQVHSPRPANDNQSTTSKGSSWSGVALSAVSRRSWRSSGVTTTATDDGAANGPKAQGLGTAAVAVAAAAAAVAAVAPASVGVKAAPPAPKPVPICLIPALRGETVPADESQIGSKPPSQEERRWIEAALRRMFRSLVPTSLEALTLAFREWRLPANAAIVKQAAPIATGPGLCVLLSGVIDVIHCPRGGTQSEKVCTYDRCGQCFGEIELFFDSPHGQHSGRKSHWATIATRTPVTLWTVSRNSLRAIVPGASAQNNAEQPPSPNSSAAVTSGIVGPNAKASLLQQPQQQKPKQQKLQLHHQL